MDNKKKVLYFEGAGWSKADDAFASGVGNCRIRTAFHLDDGKAVYLELTGSHRTKHCSKEVYLWDYTGFVDSCHYITDDNPNDDSNLHQLMYRFRDEEGNTKTFPYTREGILEVVNSLGASFDEIIVVPDLGGYRVFPEKHTCKGSDGYYYGDTFEYNEEVTARREQVDHAIYALEKKEYEEDWIAKKGRLVHAPGSRFPKLFSLGRRT